MNTRYPYTYAYDWVREAGLAESRGDAAFWCKHEAIRRGVEKDYLCRILADQYVKYYEMLQIANDFKTEAFKWLRG